MAVRYERGSALVLVTVFVVVVFALLMAVTSSALLSSRDGGQRHRDRLAASLLGAGAAMSLNEINRGEDLDGDGAVGSVGANAWGRRFNSIDGRALGCVRVTVGTESERTVLLVVVAVPTFSATTARAAAKYEIQPADLASSLGGERAALLFDGPLGKRRAVMRGKAAFVDGSRTVPGVRISDEWFLKAFLKGFVKRGARIVGVSTGTGEEETGRGADSVAQGEGGLVDASALSSLEDGLRAWAGERVDADGTAALVGDTARGRWFTMDMDANESFPGDSVFWYGRGRTMRIERGATLSGSGTLVVNGNLAVRDGGVLNWDGDVIVLGNARQSRLDVGWGSRKQRRGELNVTGNVVVLGRGRRPAMLRVLPGGSVGVEGAVLVLASGGNALLRTRGLGSSGGDLKVEGLLGVLGRRIDTRIVRSTVDVEGMFALAGTGPRSMRRFQVVRGRLGVSYDATLLERAVLGLANSWGGFDVEATPTSWSLSSYHEVSATAALQEQAEAIAGANEDGVGLPDGAGALSSRGRPAAVPRARPAGEPVNVGPSAQKDPTQSPRYDPALGIVLDAQRLLSRNDPCHCGALKAARAKRKSRPYRYRQHHGKAFWK